MPSSYLGLLRNRLDVTRVPFSDRGSRLLVFQSSPENENRLLVKLAERLTWLRPDMDAYRHRPPFIRGLSLVDAEGTPLHFEIETHPHALRFHTELGDFGLVFQDRCTLSFGLPPR